MAVSKAPTRLLPLLSQSPSSHRIVPLRQMRSATTFTGVEELSDDVDPSSSFPVPGPTPAQIKAFNPIARTKRRQFQLPSSRYQYRPPKYYRGPLHPHQPPPATDPNSRLFVPGPFSLPRLEQTYHSTLAPDLLTLLYAHHPPGTLPGPCPPRLRSWDDSSPYHKNRPLRGPRGGSSLPLLDRPITFRNVPRLEKIHVHAFLKESTTNPHAIHVAGMVMQAITNVRATVHRARHNIGAFKLKKGSPCAVGVELRGEEMWDFLGKCVEVVMPQIKEFRGISGRSGDKSGDIAWGFDGDTVGKFPEIECNYDAYPARMIPKIDVTCCTTATNDRDGRILLASLGVPFYGKHHN